MSGQSELSDEQALICECRPCAGRGNDGHGMTHCAECCWGTGVDADLDCPTHGSSAHPPGTPSSGGDA